MSDNKEYNKIKITKKMPTNKEYNKIKIICECGSESSKKHIGRHLKSNKHIKWEKDMELDEGTMDSWEGEEDNEIWGTGQEDNIYY